MIKQILVITALLITVFIGSYFLTALAVKMIMGNEVYGQEVTVTAEVEGLKVEPNYGTQTDNHYKVQPAYNVNKLTNERLGE